MANSSLPSKVRLPMVSPGKRIADDAGERLAAPLRLAFARGADRGHRQHLHLGAGIFRARHGPAGEPGEDRFEPVVALWWRWSALVAAKHDAVDARREQARPQAVRRRSGSIRGSRSWRVRDRRPRPGRHSARRARRSARSGGRAARSDRGRRAAPHASYRPRSAAPSSPRASRAGSSASPPASSGAKVSAGEPSRSPGMRKRPGGRVESA